MKDSPKPISGYWVFLLSPSIASYSLVSYFLFVPFLIYPDIFFLYIALSTASLKTSSVFYVYFPVGFVYNFTSGQLEYVPCMLRKCFLWMKLFFLLRNTIINWKLMCPLKKIFRLTQWFVYTIQLSIFISFTNLIFCDISITVLKGLLTVL